MANANHGRAHEVFAAWRSRVEGGEDLVIEDLCRDHPQHADALLHLHADWVLAKSALPSTAPPATRCANHWCAPTSSSAAVAAMSAPFPPPSRAGRAALRRIATTFLGSASGAR
jgi:hypothetical protein